MSFQVILLVGQDEERVPVLLAAPEEKSIIHCHHEATIDTAEPLVASLLPDLILLFADALEEVGEDVNGFCQRLREGYSENRPIVIIHSATEEEEKRISYLISGADDILSAHLRIEELRIRMLVHLRRNLEVLSNKITRIPSMGVCTKVLQRKINQQEPWALLLVELDHFEVYTEVYGQIPGDQVLRTFAALLGAFVIPPDFVGHAETNTFLIITHPDKAEKIASLLCRQFETVTPNFYSEKDKKRGYIVSIVDEQISRRVELLSLSIGIVSNQTQDYDSYKAAFTAATNMKNLAKLQVGNHWISERFKLTGLQEKQEHEKQTIIVIESDAALAFLLKTTLEMQHYDVETVSTLSETEELFATKPIHMVLMDSLLSGQPVGWELCRAIKTYHPETLVVFISTLHDRESALGAGADLYLPKPFELIPLFTWIERLLKRA